MLLFCSHFWTDCQGHDYLRARSLNITNYIYSEGFALKIIPNEYNKIMPWDPLGYGQYQSDGVDGFRHQIWHCFGNTKLLLLILGKAIGHLDVYFVSMLNLAKFRMSHSKQNTPHTIATLYKSRGECRNVLSASLFNST